MAGYIVDGVQLTQEQAEHIAAQVAARRALPTFAVGNWVQHKTEPWAKARQVSRIGCCGSLGGRIRGDGVMCEREFAPEDLRHATIEEVAEAKRIDDRVGLLVRRHSDDSVWLRREWAGNRRWRRIDPLVDDWEWEIDNLTTDHYTVLDSYTVRGAK